MDDSPQFAYVFLPLNYDPGKTYPMVVYLHGHNSRNPPYAASDAGVRHKGMAERYDLIRLEPHGRGNSSYRGIGEADVMRAVALARKTFNVDDERIYLLGASMGGGAPGTSARGTPTSSPPSPLDTAAGTTTATPGRRSSPPGRRSG